MAHGKAGWAFGVKRPSETKIGQRERWPISENLTVR
jgi:hypothetical protein